MGPGVPRVTRESVLNTLKSVDVVFHRAIQELLQELTVVKSGPNDSRGHHFAASRVSDGLR